MSNTNARPSDDLRHIQVAMWGEAKVSGLEVTGDLFGASHCFAYRGHRVEIRVPNVQLDEQLLPTGKHQQIASFRSGRGASPDRDTNSYAITLLEASIELPASMSIPQTMLSSPPTRPDLAGPELSATLERVSIDYEGQLAGAVVHWKSVVSWVTGSRAIDTPNVLPGRAAQAAFDLLGLIDLADRKRFWRPPAAIAVQKQAELDREVWARIGKVLADGEDAPIWSRFIDQAFSHLQYFEDGACVIACAIACETVAKQVNSLSPRRADGTLNVHPAKGNPSMATVIGDWEELTGIDDVSGRTIEIRELVKIRNDLMHSGGQKLPLDHDAAQRFFDAASKFVAVSERAYFAKVGKVDPRRAPS